MCIKYQEKQGKKLRQEALSLGVSLHAAHSSNGVQADHILQQRVREAKRARRESSLWLIALFSAIASLVSAVAAWFAVIQ